MKSLGLSSAWTLRVLMLGTIFGTATAEPVNVHRPDFWCKGTKDSIRLPNNLSALKKLAQVQNEEVILVEDYGDYKAIEKKINFKGLSIQLIAFSNDPERYMLASASIESPRWKLSPFRVGDGSAPILIHLGVPNPVDNGEWSFSSGNDALYIESKNGRVSRVTYSCYTG